MIRVFVLICGLSLSQAYTIKVSGKVELGNQLSKLFKELYSQLTENGVIPPDFISENGYDGNNANGFEITAGRDQHENSREETYGYETSNEKKVKMSKKKRIKHAKHVPEQTTKEPKDIPVLDKMMKNDLEKLHLYGYHKFQEKKAGEPLNNVHLK